MNISFKKYHALGNDFIIVESKTKLTAQKLSKLALLICDRNKGVGADGILYLSTSKKADRKFIIYNSDGSQAEKSGNGLRIAALYLYEKDKRKKKFSFETLTSIDSAQLIKYHKKESLIKVSIGRPEFESKKVPVKSKLKFMINSKLTVNKTQFPVTCLSVGNPHTVLFVDNFNFDWQQLGSEIEIHKAFPERTNVEFVKVINRKKIKVADWERGAGATGSSGTGASAAVAASVMMGITERDCEVQFENGSLFISWNADTDIIELTGPVEFIASGEYEL
ncbi:MAG: diaminopimelate epimerase [Calditrichaeota bacterium]|nr:MAG: diaminopimelate epimerase [Calditrichota bacterium]